MEENIYKKKIFSNYELFFPFEFLNAKQLIDLDAQLSNSAIGISELQTIADSRRSSSNQNLFCTYFVLQSRHRSVNLYWDSQFEHQVDRRIRDNTDIKIITEKRKIYDEKGNPVISKKSGQQKVYFHLTIIDLTQGIDPIITICDLDLENFYDKYNTDYIVNIFNMKKEKRK